MRQFFPMIKSFFKYYTIFFNFKNSYETWGTVLCSNLYRIVQNKVVLRIVSDTVKLTKLTQSKILILGNRNGNLPKFMLIQTCQTTSLHNFSDRRS